MSSAVDVGHLPVTATELGRYPLPGKESFGRPADFADRLQQAGVSEGRPCQRVLELESFPHAQRRRPSSNHSARR